MKANVRGCFEFLTHRTSSSFHPLILSLSKSVMELQKQSGEELLGPIEKGRNFVSFL